MLKIMKDDGSFVAVCNYFHKEFQWSKSGGYSTFRKHITSQHAVKQEISSSQAQISSYATPNHQLFKYKGTNNREELAEMVAVGHLPFSFGEKVGFINYCR